MAYPELVIDWRSHPQLADNVWHAQMAGHPKVLTYSGPDVTLRRSQRSAAMRFEHAGADYEIPPILSRDEYPFACTAEGGRTAWVGHIPGGQNSAQGGLIAQFLKRHGIVAGRGEHSKFLVKVANHPRGPASGR